jgi:ribosomal protein L36
VVERGKVVVYNKPKKRYKIKEKKKVVRRRGLYLVLNTLKTLHFRMVAKKN